MTLTLAATRPTPGLVQQLLFTYRGLYGDVPNDAMSKLAVAIRETEDDTPPATDSDGTSVFSPQTVGNLATGTYRLSGTDGAAILSATVRSFKQTTPVAPASGHHWWAILIDQSGSAPFSVLAYKDVTPA